MIYSSLGGCKTGLPKQKRLQTGLENYVESASE